ncbi:MAG: hypothetical protein M3Y30_07030 [Gemmatimonadota bacterium]|nr:hypothetical protein [Gemmatimonadota bacterium]
MSKSDLATYLKDHDAGSEAALGILDHLEARHREGRIAEMVRSLRPQFEGERVEVHKLLKSLDDSVSVPRRMFGWLSEKALQLKLKADDPDDGPLRVLETVEMLALGVHGKLGMWIALDANKACLPLLQTVPFAKLIAQAEEQERLIQSVRMDAAKEVMM